MFSVPSANEASDVIKDVPSKKPFVPLESSRKSVHPSQDGDLSSAESRPPRQFRSPTPSCILPFYKDSESEEELSGIRLKLWQEMQKMDAQSGSSSSSDEDLSLTLVSQKSRVKNSKNRTKFISEKSLFSLPNPVPALQPSGPNNFPTNIVT